MESNKYLPKHTTLGHKRNSEMENESLRLSQHPVPPECAWQQQWQDGIPSRAILFKEELPTNIPLIAFAKIMRKMMFDFMLTLNSNKTLLSLFSFLVWEGKLGENVDRKKKRFEVRKK